MNYQGPVNLSSLARLFALREAQSRGRRASQKMLLRCLRYRRFRAVIAGIALTALERRAEVDSCLSRSTRLALHSSVLDAPPSAMIYAQACQLFLLGRMQRYGLVGLEMERLQQASPALIALTVESMLGHRSMSPG